MSWKPTATFTGHRGAVYALAPTANESVFLSAGGDGRVVRWDLRTTDRGELVADALQAIYALHHDRERRLLFLGNGTGGLHVIDLTEGEEIRLLKAHQRGIFHLLPLPGDRLACAAGDGSLSIWHLPSMDLERRVPLCEEKVRQVALHKELGLLAVACGDGLVRVLDATDLNERHTLNAHEAGVGSVAWHPTKPVLISGGRDGHLRFWRSDNDFEPLRAIAAHRANIYGIAFNADATLCATASRDKSVKVWDAATFDVPEKLDLSRKGHTHSVNVVQWTKAGGLLSASDDRRILGWTYGPS